jgi:hypothetical protein
MAVITTTVRRPTSASQIISALVMIPFGAVVSSFVNLTGSLDTGLSGSWRTGQAIAAVECQS